MMMWEVSKSELRIIVYRNECLLRTVCAWDDIIIIIKCVLREICSQKQALI